MEKKPKEVVFSTKEQVEEAIADIKARCPGFESIYEDESRCVTFRYKGAEDCVNLSVPLKPSPEKPLGVGNIYARAKLVSKGRIALMGHDVREFGNLPGAGGKNAYTNNVLAG